ncbi:MAG: methyltransferase domain-containing protein [Lachnospiraceae bacterium]|nr:methyltransferase domain-containing protein [Lachnospiraceae bacterium]
MKTSDNRAFWDKVAGIYGNIVYHGRKAQKAYDTMTDLIGTHLNRNMDVLELACGPGILSFQIVNQCRSLEATDFSQCMIAEAKDKNHSRRLHFSVQDATNLPYGQQTFDAVLMANALHIMPEPEQVLENIKSVLKPEGIFLCPTFTREVGKYTVKERLMELAGFRTYSRWTHESFLEFLRQNGFRIADEKIIRGHNFPISFVMACKQK